ncbi:hypothetical protein Tco_0903330 [Tanacetum coccineum]
MDACSFDLNQLNEEVLRHYPSHSDQVFSIVFVDKYVTGQSFIGLNSDENFMAMLIIIKPNGDIGQRDVIEEPTGDGDSDHCPSDESYFSHLSSDDDNDDVKEISKYDYLNTKKSPTMERIHASVKQADITFEVKNLTQTHICTRSNMGGNRRVTQGWIESVVMDKVRSDGDVALARMSSEASIPNFGRLDVDFNLDDI